VKGNKSVRRVAADLDTSRSSIQRMMKTIKCNPYRLKKVQELNLFDPDKRCDDMALLSVLLMLLLITYVLLLSFYSFLAKGPNS
jgi:hypothetical protein